MVENSGSLMTAFKALTLGVLGWPDRALGHHPVIEVPAIQLLRDPMQENPERFLLTLPMLPVFADPSSFPQSDVLTPVVQLQPNTERLKPQADFLSTGNRLPDVSQWILRTIRHGYTIQFRNGPPLSAGSFPRQYVLGRLRCYARKLCHSY